MSNHDGTGKGLIEFFDYLADKGLMNKSTAGARKTAALKVLSIDKEWEDVDLESLNLEEQVTRFATLEKANYKPNSLNVYKSRFKNAVEEYLSYLDDPAGFKATSSSSSSSNAGNGNATRKKATEKPAEKPNSEQDRDTSGADNLDRGSPPASPEGLLRYPFPLRPGTQAFVYLPPDLSEQEAERFSRFVSSLALPGSASE